MKPNSSLSYMNLVFPATSKNNEIRVEVTVTVHCVICCTNFVPDSDSHLEAKKEQLYCSRKE